MQTRRNFIQKSLLGAFTLSADVPWEHGSGEIVMTVTGPVSPGEMQFTLTHEHVLVDFAGAENYHAGRYDANEVYNRALPFLQGARDLGCKTFVDCTPAYLGRDVTILRKLSEATGLQILTNTGLYGASQEKFYPKFVYTESAAEIARHWIDEWTNGIDGTGIRPGFIKLGVDKYPLTAAQHKVIEAAAITHLASGLPIAIHTGDGKAASEELTLLATHSVSPEARIWVHAQNEKDMTWHEEAALKKSWISFDNITADNLDEYLHFLLFMKNKSLLDHVLMSQDSGWYHVGSANGGDYSGYTIIMTKFIPLLKVKGFTKSDIDTVFIRNPAKAFTIKKRII